MPRIPPITQREGLSALQEKAFDSIAASRGRLPAAERSRAPTRPCNSDAITAPARRNGNACATSATKATAIAVPRTPIAPGSRVAATSPAPAHAAPSVARDSR